MKETTVDNILNIAQELAATHRQWHFHILAPDCQLNESEQFALLLEIPAAQEVYVSYSTAKPAEIGKTLVQLLHGNTIIEPASESSQPNERILPILEKINVLDALDISWHHHMLFPDCRFNDRPGRWVIVLEDPATGERLVADFDAEPKNELRQIERLFYRDALS